MALAVPLEAHKHRASAPEVHLGAIYEMTEVRDPAFPNVMHEPRPLNAEC
jgi:hypothetical protein